MIVFHHNDLDGKCAAALCYNFAALPTGDRCEFVEMNYAKPVPFDTIQPGERVWIVDFSFSVEDMTKLLKITRDIVWIDHHKTAIDKFKDFPEKIRGIRKDGEAGCVLTWKYLHWWSDKGNLPEDLIRPGDPKYPVPYGVELLGDYDTWTLQYTESVPFYEGMKVMDLGVADSMWLDLCVSTGSLERRIIVYGNTVIRYRDAYCAGIVKTYGFESSVDGVRCWVTNLYGFGSLGFGSKMQEYPICAACVFDGKQWTVSLYSTSIDVSEICKRRGGGGHKGAAGFVSKEFPFERKADA